ncbi:MAG: hypothetical protein AB8B91_17480, partial [Rubripirellula sp.]
TPLLILRSPQLDLQQRNLQASLATARTRLESLVALRTRSSSQTKRAPSSSAEENVIETEIAGIAKQLQLIQEQQAALTICSPADGIVDRWDLRPSLTARPVTHGQYLLDVVSESKGWNVELLVPDENIQYVLDQQRNESCSVAFRLRSDAANVHDGAIESIADVAHVDSRGKSMVRAVVPLPSQSTDKGSSSVLRHGASVLAHIDCGERSLGFVWTRSVIEWWRTNAGI